MCIGKNHANVDEVFNQYSGIYKNALSYRCEKYESIYKKCKIYWNWTINKITEIYDLLQSS